MELYEMVSSRLKTVVPRAAVFMMGTAVCLPAGATTAEPAADEAPITAQSRVRVAPDSGLEAGIRQCLDNVVDATNAEDLDAFCDCFTGPTKSKMRKRTALRFVQHDVTMELLDAQILDVDQRTGKVAVKYRLVLSDDRFEVVALVEMKRDQSYWRISSEKIQSLEHQSPTSCSPSRYACLGGTCRVVAGR